MGHYPSHFYRFAHAGIYRRADACRGCGEADGARVGRINYFGLSDYDMAQCGRCGLIGIDPIPASEVVAEGCRRLYASGYGDDGARKILRGFGKSFRKGAAFARRHLKVEKPLRILEIGAGDGYFSAGVASAVAGSRVCRMDVVAELGEFYSRHHPDGEFLLGEFGAEAVGPRKFDLVIFRDLLEHVRDPMSFLVGVNQVLEKGGRAFFITPNGREDFWMIHQRFLKTGTPTLLLLNHFYYFLPETLAYLLEANGFRRIEAHKFGLKHHKRGLGTREFAEFDPQTLPCWEGEARKSVVKIWAHEPGAVRGHPLNRGGMFSKLYSAVADREETKVDYLAPMGHEFFVLVERA